MSEAWLLFCFLMLTLFALSLALYPLRKFPVIVSVLAPVLIIFVGVAYWHWGAWSSTIKQQRVQAMLKSMPNPPALIAKLKATLEKQPDSARGWYLLGRLYVSQNQWQEANEAFAMAHRLQPDDEQMTVNYIQNLWQLNHQAFDDKSRTLLNDVLERNANQPDALAMLAMDAYIHHQYQRAIDYWQHLLKLAPPQSEEAVAIRKAIAKAQAQMSNKPLTIDLY